MTLYNVYVTEKQSRFNELYKEFKGYILNSRYNWIETINSIESKLYNEFIDKFYVSYDEAEEYQFIDLFVKDFFRIELLNSFKHFDDEFIDAKFRVREKYEKEDFFKHIEIFLNKDQELIIKQVAHYMAYKEVQDQLFGKDKQKIKELFEMQIKNDTPIGKYADKMPLVVEYLQLLNGYYNGSKIMNEKDYSQLFSNFQLLLDYAIDTGDFSDIKFIPIPSTGLSNDYLRTLFYKIFKILIPKRQASVQRENYIRFIRSAFEQLYAEGIETTRRKFAINLSGFNRISKNIKPEQPV